MWFVIFDGYSEEVFNRELWYTGGNIYTIWVGIGIKTMPPQPLSPQTRIWQLGLGFTNTAVLYTLVKTGVIEQLRHQPRSLAELAQDGGLDSNVLCRVLRFAAVLEVIEQNEDRYSLTETGRLLLKNMPGSVHHGVLLWGSEEFQRVWHNLAYSLTTGGAAFPEVMGSPAFEYFNKNLEFGAIFNQWMTDTSTQAAQAVTADYDFTPFRSVCDVGGGQGLLLKSILLANPHLRGILFDLEDVVKNHVLAGLDGRVEIQAGNFFEHVPAAGLLMMKRILHDWDDGKCQAILANCRRVMRPDSRLLIIERVISPTVDITEVYADLLMQLMHGGKERTEAEFGAMLQNAGMKLQRVIPTSSTLKIVEASL